MRENRVHFFLTIISEEAEKQQTNKDNEEALLSTESAALKVLPDKMLSIIDKLV